MKSLVNRQFIHALLVIMSLVMMIGGIVKDKPGATVIGIIVMGVNGYYWLKTQRQRNQSHHSKPGN